MKNRKLTSAHFGNGLTVYDLNTEDPATRDYQIVAHISPGRVIHHRKVSLSARDKRKIRSISRFDNRRISFTQEQKVFYNKPKLTFIKDDREDR